MSYYQYHVFLCSNQRDDGRPSCGDCGAAAMRDFMKARCKALGLSGPGRVRINSAGCMDRCAEGPVMVIYPEGFWYSYIDRDDIEEIVQRHLIRGERVERLELK